MYEPAVCWRQWPEPGPSNPSSPAAWPGLCYYPSVRDWVLPGLSALSPWGCSSDRKQGWCLPSLAWHNPLCCLPGHGEDSQQALTSEPSFTTWACLSFLPGHTTLFFGKPWLIKEVIAVSQAEWILKPVKKDQATSNCTQEIQLFPRVEGSRSVSGAKLESDCNWNGNS